MLISSSSLSATASLAVVAEVILSQIHELPTVKFLALYAAVNCALLAYTVLEATEAQISISTAVTHSISTIGALNATFVTVLTIGAGIRRLFFHPLCKFPGERLAPLTKLYEARYWFNGTNASRLIRLHQRYGDFVRTGPEEISINNVEALKSLYTRSPNVQRGPFYEVSKTVGTVKNLLTQRDDALHQSYRRIWERGFRGDALVEYAPRLESHTAKMVALLDDHVGAEIDVHDFLGRMAFDIMADLGFALDSGMLDGTGDPSYKKYLQDYLQVMATLGCLRNVLDVLQYIPRDKGSKEFLKKGGSMLEHRMRIGKARRDVFTYLLGEDEETGSKFTKEELLSNAQVLVIAGGDSTSTLLTSTFRELATHPDVQAKLHKEITDRFNKESDITIASTRNLPYTRAVIDETLRKWPGVPSGVQVVTGPSGMEVAGRYIPPRTCVRIPQLALMRDERYFPQGNSWVPERWTGERPELVKDKQAFIPFALGPHACVGKQVALNELRLVVARVIFRFSIELGPSYDETGFFSNWKDYYVQSTGPLWVVCRFRE